MPMRITRSVLLYKAEIQQVGISCKNLPGANLLFMVPNIKEIKERSMISVDNLPARDLEWRKAKRSVGNGACVEVASVNGRIAVRDSMNPGGAYLQYPAESWQSFAARLRNEIIFE